MVMRRAAARCGEGAQHFSNASCLNIKNAVSSLMVDQLTKQPLMLLLIGIIKKLL